MKQKNFCKIDKKIVNHSFIHSTNSKKFVEQFVTENIENFMLLLVLSNNQKIVSIVDVLGILILIYVLHIILN